MGLMGIFNHRFTQMDTDSNLTKVDLIWGRPPAPFQDSLLDAANSRLNTKINGMTPSQTLPFASARGRVYRLEPDEDEGRRKGRRTFLSVGLRFGEACGGI